MSAVAVHANSISQSSPSFC